MKRLAVTLLGLPATGLILFGAFLLVAGLLSAGGGGFGGAIGSGIALVGFLMVLVGAALLALARAVSSDRVSPRIALGIIGVAVVAASVGLIVLVRNEPDYCRGGDPGTGVDGWSTTGSMSTGRVPAIALLGNGHVLVAGGFMGTACGDSQSAELYDPASGDWTLTGRSLVAHSAFDTVVEMSDGRGLVVGTLDTTGGMTAEIYDPAAGTWAVTAEMGATRLAGIAVGLNDGRVLVAGGTGSSNPPVALASAEIYDPITDRWTPTGPMTRTRAFLSAAVLLQDGRVLVAGGLSAQDGPLKTAEIYDPAGGTWSATGDMTFAMEQGRGILLHDGRVLVLNGPRPQLYDPTIGTWTEVAGASPTSGAAAVLLTDGRVLVAGGYSGDGMTAEIYDPETGTTIPAGRMGVARQQAVAVLLGDGRVLVVGGVGAINTIGTTLSSAELYDPSSR